MRDTRRESRAKRIAPAIAGIAAALLLAWGCCAGVSLKLGRVGDFLSGVVEISGSVSVDAMVSSSFDGDFAGWADIPAFSAEEFDIDLSGAVYFEASHSFDVDYDAAAEDLRLLAADDPDVLGEPAIFAAWAGDKYTADAGVCYVGWVGATEVHLAASWCGDDGGVMLCDMPSGAAAGPTCRQCLGGSSCTDCDMGGDMEDCLPPAPSSGSVDLDVDVDIDIDIDIDVDLGVGGAP